MDRADVTAAAQRNEVIGRIASIARDRDHRNEAQPHPQRHREQRHHGRAASHDQRVRPDERRRCRMRLGDEHGLPTLRHARNDSITQWRFLRW